MKIPLAGCDGRGLPSGMRFLFAVVCLIFVSPLHAGGRTEIKAIAWPALSPDGSTVAFEWLNDIWLAPSSGGEAVRLVKHHAREAYPKFTPDGSRLVFSSERTGTAQVFSVKPDGSDLRQHSFHSEGNILEAVAPDGTYAVVRGLRAEPGYKPERLLKTDLRRDSRQIELFGASAHSVSVSPDGNRFLFCRGGEQLYRKGYRGSRASEIHLYDAASGKFTVLIDETWEARSPLWKADGSGFYYLSNRDGPFNLRLRDLSGKSDTILTSFGDSIVIPAISGDGKFLLFRAGQKIWRFEPDAGTEPAEVSFFTEEKPRDTSVRTERVKGTSAVAFIGGREGIVFSAAGDLWRLGTEAEEPVRLTESDATDEREFQLAPDGKTLFYLSDDGLECAVFQAELMSNRLVKAKRLATGGRSKRGLRLSPDGSRLVWLEATGDLVTIRLRSDSAADVVMPGWDMPTYDWSPDGKWLVVAAKDVNANRDIWLVPADGSREPFNITRHPAFEGSPKWSPDGGKIVFTARREIDGLARLWMADIGDRLGKKNVGDETLEQIADSVERLDTDISEPSRVMWTADSKAVLYQSRDPEDEMIYRLPVDGGEVGEFAEFRGIPAGRAVSGKTFWRIDRVPTVSDGGELVPFEFSFRVRQDRSARLRLGFRRIWRTLSERFYDETMNATDWDAVLEKYEDAAASAVESRQFDRVVAQLLGELNASHLTFKTKPWGLKSEEVKPEDPTANPGLVFRNTWEGPLMIDGVVPGSPVSSVGNPPQPGEIVTRIAGREVDARTPLHRFFNGAAGRPLPVTVMDQQGKVRALELVPVSYGKIRFLDREATVAEAQARAEEEGFVYLPFRKMKTAHLRELAVEIYRSSMDAKGLVLDLRDNAGGRVADELLALFCQPVHTFTVPRGGPRGYPTDRRVSPSWDGPMVVLSNGNTYSNAEIFCHAFKRLQRGKLVGTPTNGGVISAVGISIPEVGELQIPFRGWFHAETGRDLELNGAVPDVMVPLLPADQAADRDPQLTAAISALKKEIEDMPPVPEPVLKSAVEE